MNPWVLILLAAVCAVGFLIWDQPPDESDDQDADQQWMREWLEERRRDE